MKAAIVGWAIVSLAVIAATVILCIYVSPWFVLLMLGMPSMKGDNKETPPHDN